MQIWVEVGMRKPEEVSSKRDACRLRGLWLADPLRTGCQRLPQREQTYPANFL